MALKQLPLAEHYFKKGIKYHRRPEIFINLGFLYKMQAEKAEDSKALYQNAQISFGNAYELDSHSLLALYHLADVTAHLGDTDLAKKYLQNIITLNKKSPFTNLAKKRLQSLVKQPAL